MQRDVVAADAADSARVWWDLVRGSRTPGRFCLLLRSEEDGATQIRFF